MFFRYCAKHTIALLICLSAFSTARVYAGSFYYEFAGGVSRMSQLSPFYGNAGSSSTGLGWAVNNSLMANFGSGGPLEFQLGIQHRISGSSDDTMNYGFQAAYPVLRVQLSRLYFAGGYTPFVWRRTSSQLGVQDYARAENTSAFLAEAGFLWPVMRLFSLGVSGSAQFANAGGGGSSPSPVMDGTVLMRFYFGFYGGGKDHDSNEFKGWRYPFGFFR